LGSALHNGFPDELYAAFVVSSKAHAELISVDPSEVLKMPGVVDYVDHKDVPGSNATGHIIQDEEIFATTKVFCSSAVGMKSIYEIILSQVTTQGQIIGLIIADNQEIAQRAAKAVKVEYKPLTPIITIEVSDRQQLLA
jgi:xanthine dehydrogenase/oxidase